MKLKIDKSFLKSLEKLNLQELKPKIEAILADIEKAQDLLQIKQLKKLKGHKTCYRIKSGDYRIGLELIAPDTVVFVMVAHRKDIYKKFP